MRKEVIWAIIIGFILGLIITFGIYTANHALKTSKASPSPFASNGTQATPSPSPQASLEITQPEDGIVVKESKITVSGKTDPKASVAVLAEDSEELVLADESGIFSCEITLTSGANNIKVISLNKNNEKQEKNLIIVYTTAKIE